MQRISNLLLTFAKTVVPSLLLFILVMYAYVRYAASQGVFVADRFFEQGIELTIIVYLYIFLFSIQKPNKWRGVLAALPIILAYIAQDMYFHVYGRVLRVIEAQELPELFAVLPLSYGLVLAAVFFLPLIAYGFAVNYRRPYLLMLGALPLITIVLMVEAVPQSYASIVENMGNEIVKYSDNKSVESNGRLTMLLYREAQRIEAIAATAPYLDREAYDKEGSNFAAQLANSSNQHNVHLIVLESFLDPTLFQAAKFSRDPVHPEFRNLFGEKLGLSISPVFGGATAQAEFEVLCGIPAFEKLSSVEFNVFTGSPVNCTPGILKRLGYRTVATNAYKPNFFNAQPAYQGIGFDEIYFPREFTGSNPTYFQAGDTNGEEYLFDGDLFEQNLVFVAQHLKEYPGQPLMNYIMTIYGHTPHLLNEDKRPQVLTVFGSREDQHLLLAANQFYYRTQAIANYVNQLRAIDPQSIIVLVADHVPPLIYGPITYRELNYLGNVDDTYHLNRLMIVEDGKPALYQTMHHYNIPQVVFNYLTAGQYCQTDACVHLNAHNSRVKESYLHKYFQLMANAAQ